jgi:chromosome segregation ATPase
VMESHETKLARVEEQHKALVDEVHTAIQTATTDRAEMKESIKSLEDAEKESQATLTEIQVCVAGMQRDVGWIKDNLSLVMVKKTYSKWKVGGLLGGGGMLGAIGMFMDSCSLVGLR